MRSARWFAAAGIALVVVAATLASLAESYRALVLWASGHGLHGVWAAGFPLQVDSFLIVGELALFVMVLDHAPWWARLPAWAIVITGLSGSVAGNVGHVWRFEIATKVTAAVPPLAAAASLAVGLGLLKRITTTSRPTAAPQRSHRIRAAVARYRVRRSDRRTADRVRHLSPGNLHRWLTPGCATQIVLTGTVPAPPVPGLPRHPVLLTAPQPPAPAPEPVHAVPPDEPPAPAPPQPRPERRSRQGVPPPADQIAAAINAATINPELSARQLADRYLGGNRRAGQRAKDTATGIRAEQAGTPNPRISQFRSDTAAQALASIERDIAAAGTAPGR